MLGSNDAGVKPLVISFLISSKVYPTDKNAATFAIGNPVAFDAKAEDLLTLGSFQSQPFFHFLGLRQTAH